jgi:hypothetical protein
MVDDHEMEQRAMVLFRAGRGAEASALQDEFLEKVLSSGEDYCTCPSKGCKWHGKCVECVILHRGHGDHLPHCFRHMVNRRIEALSALTEHSVKAESGK